MQKKSVWMVAAENGAIPGGKAGGVGDVLRDLPCALVDAGLDVRVITPSYGQFHRQSGAKSHAQIGVPFAGAETEAGIFELNKGQQPVRHFVLEHPLLSPFGAGRIYIEDPPDRPYAADAGKFAWFCAAVCAWLGQTRQTPDILHLHDWHTGMIPVLLEGTTQPRNTRIVYTIHNLAYQGVRPLRGDASSLEHWFPELDYEPEWLTDPRYPNCVNFMAAAIRLAAGVSTVSPTYAREILRPSKPETGFFGGEGLEDDLRKADRSGRLCGILNGCPYPAPAVAECRWHDLVLLLESQCETLRVHHAKAWRWAKLARTRPPHVLLSIGRITSQKAALFLEPVATGVTAIEAILRNLGDDGVLIMLGSGESGYETRLADVARQQANFLFLQGYAEAISNPLYAGADLFLMPSSFEPCGISQMLAMRAGHPCVVHGVGGLKDTVNDGVDGFVFEGKTPAEQAARFVATVQRAIELKSRHPRAWQRMGQAAAERRFSWAISARDYRTQLYGLGNA